MKNLSIKYVVSVVLFSTCCVMPLAAQESTFMYHEGGGDDYQDKPGNTATPGTESSFTHPGTVGGGSTSVKTDKPSPEARRAPEIKSLENKSIKEQPAEQKHSTSSTQSKGSDEDPDSVLSFNFLHYIIQRFKFSEVIDQ